ncbi:MAG: hypothetical protein HC890_03425 [Chloroflexaceae bacterium]|nr:hypothetical protein [Chloroflexaceae bacterium]
MAENTNFLAGLLLLFYFQGRGRFSVNVSSDLILRSRWEFPAPWNNSRCLTQKLDP